MNKIIIVFILISLSISIQSQDVTTKTNPTATEIEENIRNKYIQDGLTYPGERCGTMPGFLERLNDPAYEAYVKNIREVIDARGALLPCDGSNSVVIPVAVHYDASFDCSNTGCLEDAAAAQIATLNEDFAALNADLAAYQNILTSCSGGPDVATTGTCLSFCLATENHPAASGIPDGEPAITVGYSSGGINAGGTAAPDWPGYLNLFVIAGNMSGVADGIPGALDGDGVSCTADVFGGAGFSPCTSGNTLNTSPVWNLGRTMTHEVGHYLGLYHVWGDVNGGGCGGDDMIADTPDQATSSSGCTANCATLAACNAGEFIQYNFMDYFDDACLVMFSEGQASVMNTFANSVTWAANTGCSNGTEAIVAVCTSSCNDGIQNGSETGIDCGGPDCPACPIVSDCGVDDISLLEENFDACVLPAGWSVTATDGGVGNITFNGGPTDVPGGGTPSPDFMGCIAIIDDDAGDDIGIGCIITPVIDMSSVMNGVLTFDWQNNDFAGTGDFIVEVFDGTSWVQVFIEEEDAFGTNETISLAGFSNSDFQIRFCHDDEGAWAWGSGFDNVSVCGEGDPMCPAAIMTDDISGSYCDGSDAVLNATPPSGNVTFAWTSSNPNIAIVDPTAATTSVEMTAVTPCQIETADITLVATCDIDGSELFNAIVSTVSVYPAPPADLTSLLVLNENTCDEPVLVDPNCAAFVTLTPDVTNPTFPVAPGQSGTASYTITYASPAGAPECCVTPVGIMGDIILDGGFESGGPGSGWTEFSTEPFDVIDPTFPLNGSFSAWLGAIAAGETYVQQTITIPSSSVTADLSFNIAAGACDCAGGDAMIVSINGAIVWDLCNPVSGQAESEATICNGLTSPTGVFLNSGPIDVTSFADDNPYVLEFSTFEATDDGTNTSIFIDDVALIVNSPAGQDPCIAAAVGAYECAAVAEIPTMGEWGLMILGFLILICSIVAIRERNESLSMS